MRASLSTALLFLFFVSSVAQAELRLSIEPRGSATETRADQVHRPAKNQDTRLAVNFPEAIKQAMLERMRRHLSNIHEIQKALAESDYDRVADVAENNLGLSSLGPHNARQAPHMPEAMQHLGMEMHRASSRLARVAQEADMVKTLEGLSQVTGLCVGCHAVYRAK